MNSQQDQAVSDLVTLLKLCENVNDSNDFIKLQSVQQVLDRFSDQDDRFNVYIEFLCETDLPVSINRLFSGDLV